MKNNLLPMNLQLFAKEGEGSEGQGNNSDQQNTSTGQQSQGNGSQQASFDYDKLASIISGKQSVAEDTVLKNYFKQQGLSKEEADNAISAYKAQKKASEPDIGKMQTQLADAQMQVQQAMLEKEATMEAITLGIDSKTIPYLLKLADLSTAIGEDGKVNKETIKNALNKVLEDVPQLKTTSENSNNGFQVGGNGNSGQNQQTNEDALKSAFGL